MEQALEREQDAAQQVEVKVSIPEPEPVPVPKPVLTSVPKQPSASAPVKEPTPAREADAEPMDGNTPKRRKIDKGSSSQILDNLKSQLDKISRDIAGISKDP